MARNLEAALEQIRGLIEDETQDNLDATRTRRTGNLHRSIRTFIENEDDFVTEFLFYGEFLDQGTRFITAAPFYSNVLDENRSIFEDIVLEAMEADLEELEQQLDDELEG